MSEVYTYQELRELALRHGIRDNKVHIGVWIQTQGYQKQRIQINHIRKTFYLKSHDWDKNPNSTWHKYHPYRWNNRAHHSSQSNNQNRQRLFKKEISRTIRATGKNKTATLLQEEIIYQHKKVTVEQHLLVYYMQSISKDFICQGSYCKPILLIDIFSMLHALTKYCVPHKP